MCSQRTQCTHNYSSSSNSPNTKPSRPKTQHNKHTYTTNVLDDGQRPGRWMCTWTCFVVFQVDWVLCLGSLSCLSNCVCTVFSGDTLPPMSQLLDRITIQLPCPRCMSVYARDPVAQGYSTYMYDMVALWIQGPQANTNLKPYRPGPKPHPVPTNKDPWNRKTSS